MAPELVSKVPAIFPVHTDIVTSSVLISSWSPEVAVTVMVLTPLVVHCTVCGPTPVFPSAIAPLPKLQEYVALGSVTFSSSITMSV